MTGRSTAIVGVIALAIALGLTGCANTPAAARSPLKVQEGAARPQTSTVPIDYRFWDGYAQFEGDEEAYMDRRPDWQSDEADVGQHFLTAVSVGDLQRLQQATGDSSINEGDLLALRESLLGTATAFRAQRVLETTPAPESRAVRRFVVISPRHQVSGVGLVFSAADGKWRVVEASSTPDIDCGEVLREAQDDMAGKVAKPAIYLYPTHPQDVSVSVVTAGRFSRVIPAMDTAGGWRVAAEPSGRIQAQDGRAYDYLFWEAHLPARYDMSTGFVVTGARTGPFLEDSLTRLGLSPKEREAFLEYWLPAMEGNRYNLIHFEGSDYERRFGLQVEPKPDTVIRVFMVYRPIDRPVVVVPQILAAPPRRGFTVVEWGGALAR